MVVRRTTESIQKLLSLVIALVTVIGFIVAGFSYLINVETDRKLNEMEKKFLRLEFRIENLEDKDVQKKQTG